MMDSYGTPHAPYHTAPVEYRNRFDAEKIILHENVPNDMKEKAKKDLAGYYAHIAALDDMIRKVINNDYTKIIINKCYNCMRTNKTTATRY